MQSRQSKLQMDFSSFKKKRDSTLKNDLSCKKGKVQFIDIYNNPWKGTTIVNLPIVSQVIGPSYSTNLQDLGK